MTHSVSVAAVVTDDADRVLLVRRADTDAWEIPGGVLNPGETLHDGLRREVLEETGLHVELDELSGIYQHLPRGIVALVFRAQLVGGISAPTAEATDVQWLTADDAIDRLAPVFAVRVRDALNADSKPALRVHDGQRLL